MPSKISRSSEILLNRLFSCTSGMQLLSYSPASFLPLAGMEKEKHLQESLLQQRGLGEDEPKPVRDLPGRHRVYLWVQA